MSQQTVAKPYHHDVQTNGTPIVPSQSDSQLGVVPVGNADGTPIGAVALGSAFSTGQKKIATTGTAVQLPANANLTQGVFIKALTSNTAKITVGGVSVTNAVDGTGNGDVLEPGDRAFYPVNNSNLLYINGTLGDIISFQAV